MTIEQKQKQILLLKEKHENLKKDFFQWWTNDKITHGYFTEKEMKAEIEKAHKKYLRAKRALRKLKKTAA